MPRGIEAPCCMRHGHTAPAACSPHPCLTALYVCVRPCIQDPAGAPGVSLFAATLTPAERALQQKMQDTMQAMRDQSAAMEAQAQQAELRGHAEDIQASLVKISDRYRTVIANLRKSDILTLSPEQTGGIAQVRGGGVCCMAMV